MRPINQALTSQLRNQITTEWRKRHPDIPYEFNEDIRVYADDGEVYIRISPRGNCRTPYCLNEMQEVVSYIVINYWPRRVLDCKVLPN
ncbi:MAG: hypothetical protein K6C32_04885 [Bacilli bacterium]|nr:hypothetical protein [Bacilli bacterium]